MSRRSFLCGLCSSALALPVKALANNVSPTEPPETVHFPSLDGRTKLVGYLFKPLRRIAGPPPAKVVLHGRAGPY